MSVNTCLWSDFVRYQWPGNGCSEGCSRYFFFFFFACELWLGRIGAFGVVLYRNQ